MNQFQKLNNWRNDKTVVSNVLNEYLLYQIYSLTVIRMAAEKWDSLPFYITEDTPKEIQNLIQKAPTLSDNTLHQLLNRLAVRRAISVLTQYRDCATPLTKDPTVPTTRRNFLSPKGEKALKILKNADKNQCYTDKMTALAHATSHKFLMDLSYYRSWHINARALVKTIVKEDEEPYRLHQFPIVQLTKGCPNHCSHCCSRAKNHLSYMPYPMFWQIHQELEKTYRKYPQHLIGLDSYQFNIFFNDSDMLNYHDDIIGADSGDFVARLFHTSFNRYCGFMTRGVTNRASEIALAKTVQHQPILLSFVDTPAENMEYNISQLQRTLKIIDDLGLIKEYCLINHLHLKSGPSVSDDVFMGFASNKALIYNIGRANEFPKQEVRIVPTSLIKMSDVIEPNGDIIVRRIRRRRHEEQRGILGSIFENSILFRERRTWLECLKNHLFGRGRES